MWRASVTVRDLLNGVTIFVTGPMEKSIVAFSTRRCTDHLLAWCELPKPALGLAVLGLVVPGPIKAEGTTTHLLDYVGPFFE